MDGVVQGMAFLFADPAGLSYKKSRHDSGEAPEHSRICKPLAHMEGQRTSPGHSGHPAWSESGVGPIYHFHPKIAWVDCMGGSSC